MLYCSAVRVVLVQAAEETVLYTAHAYVRAQQDQQQREAAQQQLSPLIRCPHLPLAWLTAALRSTGSDFILEPLKEQIGMLLSFKHAQSNSNFTESAFRVVAAPDTPASWYLGARASPSQQSEYRGFGQRIASTTVSWNLPVSTLKQACIEALTTKSKVVMCSPHVSAPLRGVAYKVVVAAYHTDKLKHVRNGVCVSVHVAPHGLPAGMCCSYSAEVTVSPTAKGSVLTMQHATVCGDPWQSGVFLYFPMPGDWDEAAWLEWAGEDWQTSGELSIVAKATMPV